MEERWDLKELTEFIKAQESDALKNVVIVAGQLLNKECGVYDEGHDK